MALLVRPDNMERISTPEQAKAYIEEQKRIARDTGKIELVLKSGEVHNDLELKQRHPQVCNAMRQCMKSEDVILYQPPIGNGTTLQIKYKL